MGVESADEISSKDFMLAFPFAVQVSNVQDLTTNDDLNETISSVCPAEVPKGIENK